MTERFCILIKPEGNGRGCLTKFLSGFFRSRCRFRCMLRFQKNAMHIGLTGFAESTVMRYLFCIEGASSPGDAYALSMATTLVPSLPCNPPRIGRPCRR